MAQYTIEQRPKINTFLPAMCPAFFIRVRPASRKAKPACMNITSTAVTTTQMVLAAISRSWFLGTDLHLLKVTCERSSAAAGGRSRAWPGGGPRFGRVRTTVEEGANGG